MSQYDNYREDFRATDVICNKSQNWFTIVPLGKYVHVVSTGSPETSHISAILSILINHQRFRGCFLGGNSNLIDKIRALVDSGDFQENSHDSLRLTYHSIARRSPRLCSRLLS